MSPAEELRAAASKLPENNFALLMELACPGLAERLAAWLESWDGVELREDGPLPDDFQHALKVARSILGTPTTPTGDPHV